MPWCDACEKYWAPSSMNDDGSCPRCGTDLDTPPLAAVRTDAADDNDERAPWHFKLMVVALVVYLVWRFADIFFG
jgi:hypothetical protein